MNTRQYFQDKTIFSLFVIAVLLSLVGILSIVLRVHSSDVLVPIRYLATSDVQRANWLNLYLFGAFYAVGSVIHIVLSLRFYAIRRGYAYAILGSYIVLAILALRIGGAVINLYY